MIELGEGEGEEWRKQLVTAFDQRTGQDSIQIHGQERKLDEAFERTTGELFQHPPDRPNDRGTMVFVPLDFEPEPEPVPEAEPEAVVDPLAAEEALFETPLARRAADALEKFGNGGRLGARDQKDVRNFIREFAGDSLPQAEGAFITDRDKLKTSSAGGRAAASMSLTGQMRVQRRVALEASQFMKGTSRVAENVISRHSGGILGQKSGLESFESFIHEEVHDRGPQYLYKHRFVVKMEEVVTETMARDIIAKKIPNLVARSSLQSASVSDAKKVDQWRKGGAYKEFRREVSIALRKAARNTDAFPRKLKAIDAKVTAGTATEKEETALFTWFEDLKVKGGMKAKAQTDDITQGWHKYWGSITGRGRRRRASIAAPTQPPTPTNVSERNGREFIDRFVKGLPRKMRAEAKNLLLTRL
jgi:hypothetical protein